MYDEVHDLDKYSWVGIKHGYWIKEFTDICGNSHPPVWISTLCTIRGIHPSGWDFPVEYDYLMDSPS